MKFFTNKNLIQKLIIIFVCIFLLEFCIATPKVKAVGGKLFAPVKLFVTAIADIVISTVQWAVTGEWISAVDDNAGELAENADKDFWKKKIDFPVIQISPELIFANQIELLNIDFISNPDKNQEYIIEDDGNITADLRKIIASWYVTLRTIAIVGSLSVLLYIGIRIMISSSTSQKSKYKQMITDWVIAFCILLFMHYIMAGTVNIINRVDRLLGDASYVKEGIELQPAHGGVVYNPAKQFEDYDQDITIEEMTGNSTITMSQIEAIDGVVSIYSDTDSIEKKEYNLNDAVNENLGSFFKRKYLLDYKGPIFIDQQGNEIADSNRLKYTYTVNDWYLNEHPDEVGGTLTIILEKDNQGVWVINGSVELSNPNCTVFTQDGINEIKRQIGIGAETAGTPVVDLATPQVSESKYNTTNGKLGLITFPSDEKTALISNYSMANSDGSRILYFINYARLYVNADDISTAFGYLILYVILVVFVVMFILRYMKRVIYVAFLTLIAPLVALTYPIDKMKDGKAQAFNMWFREYIFNVIIQPFHLLIYTILVGSAMAFASSYMIYAIIAMAFLIPAENLLRSFFGFDKAGTLTAAGSFAGGALFSTLIGKINKSKSGKSGGSGGSDSGVSNGIRKPSTEINMPPAAEILYGMNDSASVSGAQNQDSGIVPVPIGIPIPPEEAGETSETSSGGSGGYSSNGGYSISGTSGRNINIPNMSNNTRSGGLAGVPNLTDPVFKRGDRLRIARGYKKVNGEWVKDGSSLGFGARLGNAAQSAAYLPYRKLADSAKTLPKTVGRLTRKAVVGGLAGGTLGTIGLAVGAASGDPSKAFSLAAAGGTAGFYGANHYGDRAAKASGNLAQSSKVAFWGVDVKKIEQDQFDKEFKTSAKNLDILTRTLGTREKARQAIRKGHVQAFLNQGITDTEKIGKALALMNDNKLGARNERDGLEKAVALASWERNISHSIYDRTSMHRAEFIEREVEALVEAGIDEKTATKRVERILDNLEYLNS